MDILQTLSGVIADIILGSDTSKGVSTLTLSLEKKPINRDDKQILTVGIYGEKASTVYPIDVKSQVLQIELIDVIRNTDDRETLVQGIYTILLSNLENVLDPSVLDSSPVEGSGDAINKNVSDSFY